MLNSWTLQGVLDNFQDFVDQGVGHDPRFIDMLESGSTGTKHFQNVVNFHEDEYSANDAEIEGVEDDGVSNGTLTPAQATRDNWTQRFTKIVEVSLTAEATKLHGREKESIYQIGRAVTALKNQIERCLLSKQNASNNAGTGITLAKCMFSEGHLINANMLLAPNYAISQSALVDMCGRLFDNGSNADLIVCGMDAAKTIIEKGTMEHLQWFHDEEGDQVEFLTWTDYQGVLYRILPCRYMNGLDVLFTNTENWKKIFFQPWTISQLASTGSTVKYLIEVDLGLMNLGYWWNGGISTAGVTRAWAYDQLVRKPSIIATAAGAEAKYAKGAWTMNYDGPTWAKDEVIAIDPHSPVVGTDDTLISLVDVVGTVAGPTATFSVPIDRVNNGGSAPFHPRAGIAIIGAHYGFGINWNGDSHTWKFEGYKIGGGNATTPKTITSLLASNPDMSPQPPALADNNWRILELSITAATTGIRLDAKIYPSNDPTASPTNVSHTFVQSEIGDATNTIAAIAGDLRAGMTGAIRLNSDIVRIGTPVSLHG